ncbi:MAG: GDP-mannose 4,6-dehydratase [Nevskia sp.]|nr:GDP-mannose 4,6-dehydratase [Nevskia sp.]
MRQLHKAGPARSPVLVVGGAGFIGSHTVEALLEQGYRVRVLDDLSAGRLDNLPQQHPRLQIRIGDARDAAVVLSAMHGIRGCIHLAAQVSAARSVEQPLQSAERNILGFINVIEAVRKRGVQRLVYASSAAVYGDCRNLPLDENETPLPTNPYGLEKQIDELYAGLYRRLHGLPSLGLRYFNVYGPRQDPASPYSGVISKFIERLQAGESPLVFGDGRQTRDFVHVKDVAQANVLALASDYCGVCNVATGTSVDLLQLIEVLNVCIGTNAAPLFAPARPGDIRDSCGNGERLWQQLGFTPSLGLEHGLADLAASSTAAAPPARVAAAMHK